MISIKIKINYSFEMCMEIDIFKRQFINIRYLCNINDLEKITAYPNEAIHGDCVVAFNGGYEKQPKRVDVDKWYST